MNPLALVIALATHVYSGGAELLLGGRKAAFSLYPQIGVLGDNNAFDLPEGAFGFGVLVGARANLGDYLAGGYIQPRIGPVHWGDSDWSFWSMVGELEAGYMLPLSSSGASVIGVLQFGAGLRLVVPSSDKIRILGEADGARRAPQEEVQLAPAISPLLNLSFGFGWK